jgi:predicted acylesterase/phospholipase RssA
VLAHAAAGIEADRLEPTITRAMELHCVAVDVDTAELVTFAGMQTQQELWDALLATTRMPWVGGGPMTIGGRRYIDGALGASIPLAAALEAGATHVLVLQTRPFGVPRSTGSRLADVFIERHLRRLNPALVQAWRDRIPDYERLVVDIARRSSEPGADPPYVLGLRPPAGTPVVGQLERRAPVLSAAAAAAERLVEDALGAGMRAEIGAAR